MEEVFLKEGITLALVLRDRGNPLLQFLKRRKPVKKAGLGKLFGFRVKGHGDVGQLTDRHQTYEPMIPPRPDTKCPIPLSIPEFLIQNLCASAPLRE